MKRIRVYDPVTLRRLSVALASFATNGDSGRSLGDPVHEWVTEGRRSQYETALKQKQPWAVNMKAGYSSCADLGHWLMMCLGYRDESHLNRSDDNGDKSWVPAWNITAIKTNPAFVSHIVPYIRPKMGDIAVVTSPEHVCVIGCYNDDDTVTTYDYGQPYALKKRQKLSVVGNTLVIGQRRLLGWIDIERLPRAETAIAPNDFEPCELDDNPYEEGIVIPPGVPLDGCQWFARLHEGVYHSRAP